MKYVFYRDVEASLKKAKKADIKKVCDYLDLSYFDNKKSSMIEMILTNLDYSFGLDYSNKLNTDIIRILHAED